MHKSSLKGRGKQSREWRQDQHENANVDKAPRHGGSYLVANVRLDFLECSVREYTATGPDVAKPTNQVHSCSVIANLVHPGSVKYKSSTLCSVIYKSSTPW